MKYNLLLLPFICFISCHTLQRSTATNQTNNQAVFWSELQKLCGKAYEGKVVSAPANDTTFKNKILIMHVRSCKESTIKIPFVVGNDLSRTWVITATGGHLQLKHDHRHADGTEDSVTQYGGHTVNAGSPTMQLFPADQHTANILPAAAANVWWVELVPGESFTYNLRRLGTERLFSIRFNLRQPIEAPQAPWGWKDQ